MKFWHQVKRLSLGLSLALLAACVPSRPTDFAQVDWMTDAEKAMMVSKQQAKPLLIAFYASDWSPACQVLDKLVFNTVEFKNYSDANLILLKIDFSRKGMSPELEKAYSELAKQFGVEHFPVFFLADPANVPGPFKRFDNAGNSGPGEFVDQIAGILSQYRVALSTQRAQMQTQGMAAPPSVAPSASVGKSGFPSPQDLLRQGQNQPPTASQTIGQPAANTPVGLPQASAVQNLPAQGPSGYPSPQDLIKPSVAPAAPAQSTDAPLIQLK